ncbi:hypothetical protein ACFE04_028483 [Oxalis oulophora]
MDLTNVEKPTLRITNIPQTSTASDLKHFLESHIGEESIYAIQIHTARKNWKSLGHGRVQFTTLDFKSKAQILSTQNKLKFKSQNLKFSDSFDDIVDRPINPKNIVKDGVLYVGFMESEECMCVVDSWVGVRGWVMPERKRIDFWVGFGDDDDDDDADADGKCYKVEVRFDDVVEAKGHCLGDDSAKLNAIHLKVPTICLYRVLGLSLTVDCYDGYDDCTVDCFVVFGFVDSLNGMLRYAPKIYERISGENIASRFQSDRYNFCKESKEVDFALVRTTDFSIGKAFGQSTSLCWEVEENLPVSEIFSCFPFYTEGSKNFRVDDGTEKFSSTSEVVPLVKCPSDSNLSYEILFQLNSLVHTQKISLAGADNNLIEIFSNLEVGIANEILKKFHQLESTCHNPVSFVQDQLHFLGASSKSSYIPPYKRLMEHNIMSCHRALITPSKIYCLGPELETSNYVVKNFAQHASDFMRVTFVEEDWSKLPANSLSTTIHEGIFAKPYRTNIYNRILSVLRDGIVIGAKRFQFLAFSASQLRSNSVWMFASNENVKASDIQEWMGSFKKIRSISKCAARMGQLFSSSRQTLVVPSQDVEIIPDIEVNYDGVDYCFSDGIGKISLSFARQLAKKCGLEHTPSAFQIRYGGCKGVLAVDRGSFRKLCLRKSMLKFESNNKMLNVTSWSEGMPCYLNREIITLLSTLGVKDEVFEELQQEQLHVLSKMLINREIALYTLQKLGGADSQNILVQMLLQGYEPNAEPYLSMMLQSYHSNLLTDLKTRCRVHVPKGRILIGCLDENGILEYGQVFVRITLNPAEIESGDQSFFRKVDGKTAVVVGKVVVTKNPCLHPGDIRVLEAIYDPELEEQGLTNCLVFPQKGHRPHPNECSGGDLDGDLYFISWQDNLIPSDIEPPMDYTPRPPRIMEHDVTLEEIQKFFVDYMINDTLGAISTAHLVHADRDEEKARSKKCLHLAQLHSMAVDFAKTGAPAEMPKALKPREYPDFMERGGKSTYISKGALGKLYHSIVGVEMQERSTFAWSKNMAEQIYDHDLEVNGFEDFIKIAEGHKAMYVEKMGLLMRYYELETEDEVLTGNMWKKASYLQRDNRRHGETKDRILIASKSLQKEAKEWFESSCKAEDEKQKLASAWYHVSYHPNYCREGGLNLLSLPWIVADILLNNKFLNSKKKDQA